MRFLTLSLALGLHLCPVAPTVLWNSPFPPPLSPQKLALVRANAVNISTHRSVRPSAIHRASGKLTTRAAGSWELGTLAEALTELEWGRLGVFAPYSIPPPAQLSTDVAADVLSIAETYAVVVSLVPYIWDEICHYADATWRRIPLG